MTWIFQTACSIRKRQQKKENEREVEIYKYERRTEEELYMAVCLGFTVSNERLIILMSHSFHKAMFKVHFCCSFSILYVVILPKIQHKTTRSDRKSAKS